MSKNILIAIVIGIIILAAVLVARNRDTAPAATPVPTVTPSPLLQMTETPTPTQTASVSSRATPAATAAPTQGAVKEFTILARQFSFLPSTIRVQKGDRVKITLNNTDVAHGIAIPDFNFNLNAPVNTPQSAEFVADKTGAFDFFCSVFCGQGHRGMKGQLIVE